MIEFSTFGQHFCYYVFLLQDYGFALPVGVNEESYLDFPIEIVEAEAKKELNLDKRDFSPIREKLNLNIRTHNGCEMFSFKVFKNGIGPELTNFIGQY